MFVRNIRSGNFTGSKAVFVSTEKADDLGAHKVSGGDILITKMGEPPGDASLYPESCPTAVITADCIKLRVAQGLSPKFFTYAINAPVVRNQIGDITKGVAQQKISLGRFSTLALPLPPADEQRQIVAVIEKQFTRLKAGVASLKRAQAALKRYRASVLKAACEGRLVPTEAELARREARSYEPAATLLTRILAKRRAAWTGRGKYNIPNVEEVRGKQQLPEGWAWTNVEQVTSLVTSGSRGWGEFYSNSGPLFIRAQDIKTDALRLDGVARVTLPERAEGMRSFVENDDLLVTITGANVTKSAIVRRLSEVAFVSQHVALLKPISRAAAAFHFLWIVSPANGRKILEKRAYGAGKPGLSLEQVRNLPLALPPAAEQHRIVAEAERRLSVIDELEAVVAANLQRAARLRQAILQRAFSGSLSPT